MVDRIIDVESHRRQLGVHRLESIAGEFNVAEYVRDLLRVYRP
jgi:hypothetical protein